MSNINLATKYEKKISEKFFQESVLMGKTNQDYDFTGVKTITINTPLTQPLNDYNRTLSANRFGTPTEMKDYIQELTLSKDRSYSLVIDKGNLSDQQYIKESGKMVKLQLREQVVPEIDIYGLERFSFLAGKVQGIATPTKSTIVGLLADGLTHLDNKSVPDDGNRHLFIGATYWNMLRLSDQYMAIDPMAQRTLEKGVIGAFMNCKVTKVPDSWLTGVHFLFAHKNAIMLIQKLRTLNLHTKPQGIDGALIEGRHYYDAFVIGTKSDAVYSAVPTASIQANVTITPTGASHALVSASATKIMYTIDGTDPRFSPSAVQVATGDAVVLTSGTTIKAVAYRTGYFPSAVTEATYTA